MSPPPARARLLPCAGPDEAPLLPALGRVSLRLRFASCSGAAGTGTFGSSGMAARASRAYLRGLRQPRRRPRCVVFEAALRFASCSGAAGTGTFGSSGMAARSSRAHLRDLQNPVGALAVSSLRLRCASPRARAPEVREPSDPPVWRLVPRSPTYESSRTPSAPSPPAEQDRVHRTGPRTRSLRTLPPHRRRFRPAHEPPNAPSEDHVLPSGRTGGRVPVGGGGAPAETTPRTWAKP